MFNSDTFIRDRVECFDVVVGNREPVEPKIKCFANMDMALDMLYKHLKASVQMPIMLHCDVDVDGLGCGYIAHEWLSNVYRKSLLQLFINTKKVHGVSEKYIDAMRGRQGQLLIIMDSGSNDIEIIKKFECDVLIIDHHVVQHNEYSGKTAGGTYVIVNNMIENNNIEWLISCMNKLNLRREKLDINTYKVESRMSGAMVLYNVLRMYQEVTGVGDILGKAMLYQWVGLTLFSDSVTVGYEDAQYFVHNTVHNVNMEVGLGRIASTLSKWNTALTKGVMVYSIISLFNSTIRAGNSCLALDIAVNRQGSIKELKKFKEMQDLKLTGYNENVLNFGNFCVKKIDSGDNNENYAGLMAARILGDTNNSSIVYCENDGWLHGSFRGKNSSVNYMGLIHQFDKSVFAQGHEQAFGIGADKQALEKLIVYLSEIDRLEELKEKKHYLTAGNMGESLKGTYHIDDIDSFKKDGWLWKLAMANSSLSTKEEMSIVMLNPMTEPIGQSASGKVLYYNILGMKCSAFEPLVTDLVDVYVEFSNEVKAFVKNKKWR